jgi:hypothetical protein
MSAIGGKADIAWACRTWARLCNIGRVSFQRDSMATIDERRALARSHVEWGRRVIARQHQYVKELRESGRDTEAAEKLLLVFESTQKVFEYDLAYLEKRR